MPILEPTREKYQDIVLGQQVLPCLQSNLLLAQNCYLHLQPTDADLEKLLASLNINECQQTTYSNYE